MTFNSIPFAVFLAVVLGLYWAMSHRWQNRLLLVASYFFYGTWDYRFLSLIFITTAIDFWAGSELMATDDETRRKRLLFVSMTANIGMLAVFKYFGFFVDSAIEFLNWFGLEPNPPLLEILLPIGISFYTFQSMSYTIDVYRRRMEASKDFFNFATFVAYFPHLVAGPIQVAKWLLPQIENPRTKPDREKIRSALFLILLGLFKKVAIGDAVASIADKAFASSGTAGSATLALGAVAFALQIYGDFAGYSDIARGTSRLFGIELTRNFEQPYLSRSITEFWRTWHISLSTWLHDYLYIPLGGNKSGPSRTYRNLMMTMLLGGLWHGASWTFVVWGGLHGLFLSIHRAAGGYVPRGQLPALRARDIPRIVGTFSLVCLLWVFFRSMTLTGALDYLGGLFSLRSGPVDPNDVLLLGISILFVVALDIAQRVSGEHAVVIHWPAVARGASYAILLAWIVMWSGGEAKPFIYFQF